MKHPGIFETGVTRISNYTSAELQDVLAVEEPLEIRLQYQTPTGTVEKNIAVTMRTPGNDRELAAGFLFTENIVNEAKPINNIINHRSIGNVITVQLTSSFFTDIKKLERNFYTTSSCGVCGKASIEAIQLKNISSVKNATGVVKAEVFYSLPDKLKDVQRVFDNAGGLYAAALFDLNGTLLEVQEDVGRHNAVDKLIGPFF
jgi:FdhD protein